MFSGSMRHAFKQGDAHSKLQMAILSAEAFIHKLRIEVDYLGVCSFSYGATHVWGDDKKTQLLDEEASKGAIEAIKKFTT